MLIFFVISGIYWGDWTNYGIDELLIRTQEKPIIFLDTEPVERKELQHFLKTSIVVDSAGTWIKDRLSIALKDFELLEWDIGVIQDSFSQQFVLLGKGIRTGFVTVFVEPVAKFGDSCGYPSKRFREVIASDYLKGYIKGSIFNFSLIGGREPIKWGPSPRNSLVISGNSPAFDLIHGSYKTTSLNGAFFATVLNPKGEINRYFTGHRIEYNFKRNLYLGFSEVALFGGEGKPPDLYYLNPLFIYSPYRWNRKSEVNIMWGFDFNLLLNGFGAYGELMIDDYPYIQSQWGEHPKIGVNVGLRGTFSKIYWLTEYTTTTRWTYNHIVPWQKYTYCDYPIGHPIGPDFDEIFLGLVHHLIRNIDIVLNLSWLRKGEGTMDEPYTLPFPPSYWLTGEIRQSCEFEAGIKWYKSKFVLTFNSGCIIGEDKMLPKLSIFISHWR